MLLSLDKKGMLNFIIQIYDRLHHFWENSTTERGFGIALLWIYLLTLAVVELERAGLYPLWLPQMPTSHYFSIQLAFTLILVMEVISLIFTLPSSLSRSIGKQLEILTLILLRNAFKELAILPEPINVGMDNLMPLVDIAVSGAGAFCVFLCLGFYRQIMRPQHFMRTPEMLHNYINSKKLLSFVLLLIFVYIGILDIFKYTKGIHSDFFETIYTVLIFADIAMVLIAQRYMPCYYAVFRNSGFVIGTLMMRLSLSAPPLLCSGIAVFAGIYVLALTWGTNLFTPERPEA